MASRRPRRRRLRKCGRVGAATAQRNANPDVDSGAGFKDYIDYVIEAESLGYHSSFIVEHPFTGFGQVSATLHLLTWIGARTPPLRPGPAVAAPASHGPSRVLRWGALGSPKRLLVKYRSGLPSPSKSVTDTDAPSAATCGSTPAIFGSNVGRW